MASTVRHLVSKKKTRFIQDGYDLDLTYITPQIIAMGYPSEGIESQYRNDLADVQRFFHTRHPDKFKIYNLCSERSYPAKLFDNRVASYPFDDHNPPPLSVAAAFVKDAAAFIAADPQHVVAAHCKAGKGRTGTVVAMLLQVLRYKGIHNAQSSLKLFDDTRTRNGKGVTIPSQRRYVRYFEWYWTHFANASPPQPFDFDGPELTIGSFVLSPVCDFDVGGGCDPYFKVIQDGKCIYNSKKDGPKVVEWRKDPEIQINCNVHVRGDTKIVFMDYDAVGSDDKMFTFWFHTSCIIEPQLVLHKSDLDGPHKDKKCEHFRENFKCVVNFRGVKPPVRTQRAPSDHPEDDDDIPPPPPPPEHTPSHVPESTDDEKEYEELDEDEAEELAQYRWACRAYSIKPPDRQDNSSPVPPPPPGPAPRSPDAPPAPRPPPPDPSAALLDEEEEQPPPPSALPIRIQPSASGGYRGSAAQRDPPVKISSTPPSGSGYRYELAPRPNAFLQTQQMPKRPSQMLKQPLAQESDSLSATDAALLNRMLKSGSAATSAGAAASAAASDPPAPTRRAPSRPVGEK